MATTLLSALCGLQLVSAGKVFLMGGAFRSVYGVQKVFRSQCFFLAFKALWMMGTAGFTWRSMQPQTWRLFQVARTTGLLHLAPEWPL
jgi:hypothetical protein